MGIDKKSSFGTSASTSPPGSTFAPETELTDRARGKRRETGGGGDAGDLNRDGAIAADDVDAVAGGSPARIGNLYYRGGLAAARWTYNVLNATECRRVQIWQYLGQMAEPQRDVRRGTCDTCLRREAKLRRWGNRTRGTWLLRRIDALIVLAGPGRALKGAEAPADESKGDQAKWRRRVRRRCRSKVTVASSVRSSGGVSHRWRRNVVDPAGSGEGGDRALGR